MKLTQNILPEALHDIIHASVKKSRRREKYWISVISRKVPKCA